MMKRNDIVDALTGRGVSALVFFQQLAVVGIVLVLCKDHPTFHVVYKSIVEEPKPLTIIVILHLLFWFFPFATFAYALDRVGAVRAQLKNIVPNTLYLLPTLFDTEMIAASRVIIDNIEQVGPLIPLMMQDGVREHLLPVMPKMMKDLELMLTKADIMDRVIIKIAPHINDLLPYMRELVPHMEQLLPILEVDGWYKVNAHLDVLVKHIDVIAPHCANLAPHMPAMFPYIDIMAKHLDDMDLEATLPIIDKVVPLLPLMPLCEAAGLLDQEFTFKALPTLVKTIPVGPQTTGKAVQGVANVGDYVQLQAKILQKMISQRYLEYQKGGAITNEAVAKKIE